MTSQWFSICLLFLLLSQVTVNVSRQRHADVRQENVPCRNPDQEAACHCAEVIPCDKSWLQEVTGGFSMFPGGGWVHILVYLFFRKKNTGLKADNACLTYWTLPWTHKDKEKKKISSVPRVLSKQTRFTFVFTNTYSVYSVDIHIYDIKNSYFTYCENELRKFLGFCITVVCLFFQVSTTNWAPLAAQGQGDYI